jgi:hypothetical protein
MSGSSVVLKDLQNQARAQRAVGHTSCFAIIILFIRTFIQIIAIQQSNIRKQRKKLSLIEETIRSLSTGEISSFIESGSSDDHNLDGSLGVDSETGNLPDPIWDQSDSVFRCSKCSFEVIDGFCHACTMEFRWVLVCSIVSHLVASPSSLYNSQRYKSSNLRSPPIRMRLTMIGTAFNGAPPHFSISILP